MTEKNDLNYIDEQEKTPGETMGECLQWLCSPRGGNNYYGRVMSICSRVEKKGFNKAGVSITKMGDFIFTWDPDWFMLHPRPFQLMLLVHEAAHLIFNHVIAMLNQVKDIDDVGRRNRWWEILNIAADMAANDVSLRYLVNDPTKTFKKYKEELVWPESMGYAKGKTLEYYLKQLLEDLNKEGYNPNDDPKEITLTVDKNGNITQSSCNKDNSDSNDASSGDSNNNNNDYKQQETKDNKPQWFKDLLNKVQYIINFEDIEPMTSNEIDRALANAKNKAKKIAIQAARETKKSRGTIPGEIEAQIAELLKEPAIPWKDILRNMIRSGLTNKMDDSFIMPNVSLLPLIGEDIEPYPGYTHQFSTRIAIGVDTSGSVSDGEFVEFLSEIRGIVKADKGVELTLLMFDHALQDERIINDSTNSSTLSVEQYAETRYGYGGTSFTPFLKYVCRVDNDDDWVEKAHKETKNSKIFDLAILFTDGGAPVSSDDGGPVPEYLPSCPLIWAITTTGNIHPDMEPRVLRIA